MIGRLMSMLFLVPICMVLLACTPLSISTTAPYTAKQGDIWIGPTTGMEFAWVEGGTYQMGCGSWTNERVSWDDAKVFIQKLNSMSGYTLRLPTEAEWEYAARSGGKAEKYAGGSDIDAVAWYDGNSGGSSGGSTHPVGTKAPNGLGIYDMSGNLFQWCEDIFTVDAYKKHQRRDPIYTDTHSSGDSRRVVRGGSWAHPPRSARCADRHSATPDDRFHLIGFRLVRTR